MKKMMAGMILAFLHRCLAEAPGGPNCGWGNMLFKGQSGIAAHFLASTTNGTSGNATFGMTSGTNGCSTNGTITYGGKAMVNAMLDEFTADVAAGEGQTLKAVAVAMGVAQDDHAAFAELAHTHFAVLFPSADVTGDAVVDRLEALMKADARLAKYVA